MPKLSTAKADWPSVSFGDVVRQVKDRVNPEESGLERYIAGEHMETDDLCIRRWGRIGDDYLGPAFHMRFKPGQVLYGSRRTYLRKVARADFEGITANTTYVLESANPDVLLPELLPFVMQTEPFHAHSKRESKGSVNPYVNFSDLAWFEFALPPLEEQRRIVEVLQAAEAAKQKLHALGANALTLLDAVATQLLKQSALKDLYSDDSVEVPAGWKLTTFGEACERITYGFTNPMPTTQEGPWMVTAADVKDGRINFNTARRTSQEAFENDLSEKSRARIGDILLTKDGTLGRVAVVDDPGVCINQSVAVLRPSARVLPRFLAWSLRAPVMQWRLMLDVGGSAVKHIYITKVAQTRFLIPSLDEQEEIVAHLDMAEAAVVGVQNREAQCSDFASAFSATKLARPA